MKFIRCCSYSTIFKKTKIRLFTSFICVFVIISSSCDINPISAEFAVYKDGNITSNPITIFVGDSVQFVNESLTTITQNYYKWTFEGGTPNIVGGLFGSGSIPGNTPPPIFYYTPGTYQVKLEMESRAGDNTPRDTRVREGFITVVDPSVSGGCGGVTTVSDIDGYTYNVIQIGGQCWMKENLRTTKYKDGSPIPTYLSNSEWYDATYGAYAVYDNDPVYSYTFGEFYNYYAVATGNLCPDGWHIPTKSEWDALLTAIGGESAAGALKATTTWDAPNTGATNSSGFTALGSGFRVLDGSFYGLGLEGHFWSSTETADGGAFHLILSSTQAEGYIEGYPKNNGFSCRCIKD